MEHSELADKAVIYLRHSEMEHSEVREGFEILRGAIMRLLKYVR